jgi:peroxiredoxin
MAKLPVSGAGEDAMMRHAMASAALAATVWAMASGASAAPRVGQPAPDFTATTFGGKAVRLADLKGDVVVLNFWATWCAPCRRELPLLESYFEQDSKYGLQVLAVATEDSIPENKLRLVAAQLRIPFLKRMKGPYHDVGALPTNYIIDRSGKLVYAKAGAFNLDELNAILVPLLQEPIPEPPPAGAAAAPAPPG